MKKTVMFIALCCFCTLAGARDNARKEIAACPDKVLGLNYIYKPEIISKARAPEGYEPVYMAAYIRHGSRYAWQNVYGDVFKMMDAGHNAGVLTEFGEKIYEKAKVLSTFRPFIGELTPKGWDQHYNLGKSTCAAFPELFGEDAEVKCISTPVNRTILSMAGFLSGLKEMSPKCRVTGSASSRDIPEVYPGKAKNADDRSKLAKASLPFKYDKEVLRSKVPTDRILSRLFTDSGIVKKYYETDFKAVNSLFILYYGLPSVETDISLDGLFTKEELYRLWECESAEFWASTTRSLPRYSTLFTKMIEYTDEALGNGKKGARIRFTHDNYLAPLLLVFGVNGNGGDPTDEDDIKNHFRTYDCPMACCLQFVFYKGDNEILCKVLLNGEEAELPLKSVDGPYYKWTEVKGLASPERMKLADKRSE